MKTPTFIIFLSFLFCTGYVYGQPNLDSLNGVWNDKSVADSSRIKSILNVARQGYLFSQPDSAEYFAKLGYTEAVEKKLDRWKGEAAKIIGISHAIRGNHNIAIQFFSESLEVNEALDDKTGIAGSLNNIGLLYNEMGDFEHALDYLLRSYDMYLEQDNLNGKALCSGNIGSIYNKLNEQVKAREWGKKSLAFYEELGQTKGIANSLHAVGVSIAYMGDNELQTNPEKTKEYYDSALDYFARSLALRREVNDQEGIAITLHAIGVIYLNLDELQDAERFLSESLEMSENVGSPSAIQSAANSMFKLYQKKKNFKKSLEMHMLFTAMNDSLMSNKNQRAIIRQEYEYNYDKQLLTDSLEFAKKEVVKDLEIEKQDANLAKQRWMLVGAAGAACLLILLVLSIRKGKKRSDELLHNILPEEVADELKRKGSADAQLIDFVTVLFTDFKGFTALSELLSPEELVNEINVCFSAFDYIMEKYNIEKIKTIGDAYMAAGGLPTVNSSHPFDVVEAAIEIQQFMLNLAKEKKAKNELFFEIRIGVHTGPVVAGIVGVKKFQYDIWGDTVNTASRMESSGAVGKVNISETTYELIKDQNTYSFESRGKIEAKGKGFLEMFFVEK